MGKDEIIDIEELCCHHIYDTDVGNMTRRVKTWELI